MTQRWCGRAVRVIDSNKAEEQLSGLVGKRECSIDREFQCPIVKKATVIFRWDGCTMSVPKVIELYSTGRRNKRKRGEVSEEGGQQTADFCYDTQRGLVLTL